MNDLTSIITSLLTWFSTCIAEFMQNDILKLCILIPIGCFVIYKAFEVIRYLTSHHNKD